MYVILFAGSSKYLGSHSEKTDYGNCEPDCSSLFADLPDSSALHALEPSFKNEAVLAFHVGSETTLLRGGKLQFLDCLSVIFVQLLEPLGIAGEDRLHKFKFAVSLSCGKADKSVQAFSFESCLGVCGIRATCDVLLALIGPHSKTGDRFIGFLEPLEA